jgi:hypothetical protein
VHRGVSSAIKTDAVDHGDDHFYPGPTDVAWDLAATRIEFDLSVGHADVLLGTYARLAGDPRIGDRLPFFELAYLAFRVGYTSLASEALANTADGTRFAAARARYLSRLRDAWRDASRGRSAAGGAG